MVCVLPILQGTIFSTLAGEKPSSDYKKVRSGRVRVAAQCQRTDRFRIGDISLEGCDH